MATLSDIRCFELAQCGIDSIADKGGRIGLKVVARNVVTTGRSRCLYPVVRRVCLYPITEGMLDVSLYDLHRPLFYLGIDGGRLQEWELRKGGTIKKRDTSPVRPVRTVD